MSKWNDCAEKIYNIIANSSYDYRYRTEEILENVFDTIGESELVINSQFF